METNDTKKDRNKEQFQDKKGLTQDAIDNSTDTHYKSNKRLFVFGSIILLIFASFLVVFKVVFNGSFNALADTPEKINLSTAFRNMAKTRPTEVKGSVTVNYNDNGKSVVDLGLTYSTVMDTKTGSSAGNGTITINNTSFPYSYIVADKDQYFNVSNLQNLKTSIKPSNIVYNKLSPGFNELSNSSGKWLVQKRLDPARPSIVSPYGCAVNTYPHLSSSDAQKLQAAFTNNSPIDVVKSSTQLLNGERVTETDLVPAYYKNVIKYSEFLNRLQEIDAVKTIDKCSQKIANTPALSKVLDAMRNENVKVSIFYNSKKVIKKITLETKGNKSKVKFSADFNYDQAVVKKANIKKPSNSQPSNKLIDILLESNRIVR
jgi:hypothetical protein